MCVCERVTHIVARLSNLSPSSRAHLSRAVDRRGPAARGPPSVSAAKANTNQPQLLFSFILLLRSEIIRVVEDKHQV